MIKVVHYTNQFFAQIGGEEKADTPITVFDEAIGPGRAINTALGEQGKVVATVVCGDNYIAERLDEVAKEVAETMAGFKPDFVIAGPGFASGRLGLACGAVCKAVQDLLGIPAVTAMQEENPGQEIYHKSVYIFKTGMNSRSMASDMKKMVDFAIRLKDGDTIGSPYEEGYYPKGYKINVVSDKLAPTRAVDMLLDKIHGREYKTEVLLPRFDFVEKAPPVKDLKTMKIALVTDGGLVPAGNPDGIESLTATKYGSYSIDNVMDLDGLDYDVVHNGYDNTFVRQDPDRLVPVDVMRELEADGTIGSLYDCFLATTGVATPLTNSKRIGSEMAMELLNNEVDAVLLTST